MENGGGQNTGLDFVGREAFSSPQSYSGEPGGGGGVVREVQRKEISGLCTPPMF
jgi:hypothetical protein